MFNLFKTVLIHELRLYFRRYVDITNSLVFFMLTIILFPIGVGPDPEILRDLGYGVIWVAAIFSAMFGIRAIFEDDYDDGSLNLYQTLPINMELLVLAKIIANWVAYSLPVVIISPIAGAMFGLVPEEWAVLGLSLAAATPIFVMIGTIGSALMLGSKKGRIMLSLIVMPFYIPILIFGVNISRIYIEDINGDYSSSLMILFGGLLFFLPISVLVSSFSIRND